MLNLQGKIAGYDYFSGIEKLTDNAGLGNLRVSSSVLNLSAIFHANRLLQDLYEPFMRMIWEWQYLKMLKRAGRAHFLSGIEGTKPGKLAISCPACPRPGINLPEDWKERPANEQ